MSKKMRYHVIIQVFNLTPQVVATANDPELAMTLFAIKVDHWGNKNGVLWLRDTKVGVHEPILAESRPYQ